MGNHLTTQGQIHSTGDLVLSAVLQTNGLIGELVGEFPGSAKAKGSDDWLDHWFRRIIETIFNGEEIESIPDKICAEPILSSLPQQVEPGNTPSKLLTIQPHFFRGFRDLTEPINLSSNLVVLDGRNSSGKTSLAEALEWLFTGGLLRRSLGESGNPRELENCVGNQFRPENEETWVEAKFRMGVDGHLTLRRVLDSDYGATQTSQCESRLFRDGIELGKTDEIVLIDKLFANSPPLLMQHSLQMFVQSNPKERRHYFERLLKLDELTHLIEKAVIGPARFDEFPSPSDSVPLKQWQSFKSSVREKTSKTNLGKVEKAKREDKNSTLQNALTNIASDEFSETVKPEMEFNDVKATLLDKQKSTRQRSFPLLGQLQPDRIIDESLTKQLTADKIEDELSSIKDAFQKVIEARASAKHIQDSQMAISKAFRQLENAGLLANSESDQTCPICAYEETYTLTSQRMQEIESWEPAQKAVQLAEEKLKASTDNLADTVVDVKQVREAILPRLPKRELWEKAEKAAPAPVLEVALASKGILEESSKTLEELDKAVSSILDLFSEEHFTEESLTTAEAQCKLVVKSLETVISQGRAYASSITILEAAVGSRAKEDPDYKLRELWLYVGDNLSGTVDDLIWENSKSQARKLLKNIRDKLIALRQDLLEHRRGSFNTGMKKIWDTLREDRYSAFDQLFIPEPRGKGFPVEIEVKASLDNSQDHFEVDALKVFSESQVNVVGIAAFITRSKLLGHRILILDDPVQSMDEEHFKTFASDLLKYLLEEQFQVIILTHNDTFAGDVSYAHCDSESYATLSIEHRRRTGCQVKEGNRRVKERLKRAARMAEEGELKDGWREIRFALERFYTVVYKKYGPPKFKPSSWIDQTAEAMWNEGAGKIIKDASPGIGRRLKEILDMTAAGAHVKPPHGATDLLRAKKDINELTNTLNIVD